MYEDTGVQQCNSDPLLMHWGWVLFDFLFCLLNETYCLKIMQNFHNEEEATP